MVNVDPKEILLHQCAADVNNYSEATGLGVNCVECFILINEVFFWYMYTRMAFKDLLVNYAKTQTRLAVTAMKVSVRCITTLHCWWKPHAVSSFLCSLISPRYVCP